MGQVARQYFLSDQILSYQTEAARGGEKMKLINENYSLLFTHLPLEVIIEWNKLKPEICRKPVQANLETLLIFATNVSITSLSLGVRSRASRQSKNAKMNIAAYWPLSEAGLKVNAPLRTSRCLWKITLYPITIEILYKRGSTLTTSHKSTLSQ